MVDAKKSMLGYSGFKQAWPQPLDLLFQMPLSLRPCDNGSETICSTPSARSISLSTRQTPSDINAETIYSVPSTRSVSPSRSQRPSDGNYETLCSAPSSRSISPSTSTKRSGSNAETIDSDLLSRPTSPSKSQRLSGGNAEILCSVLSSTSDSPSTSPERSGSSAETVDSDVLSRPISPSETERPRGRNFEIFHSVPSSKTVSGSASPSLSPAKQKTVHLANSLQTPSSIRLLKIHEAPNQKTSIACTLQSVDLAEKPRYRALSYTWGPAIRAFRPKYEPSSSSVEYQQILCNEEPLFVTQNLHEALLEFRQSGFVDWLWVDAICIDQSNADERARQVSIMGQIYMSAKETIAWLGQDESGAEDVQWGIEAMVPKMLRCSPALWGLRSPTIVDFERIFAGEDLSRRLIGITTFLSTRQWFHRAWVGQEAALAPAISFRAGKRQFSWIDLTNLSTVLERVPWGDELLPQTPALKESYFFAAAFLKNLQGLRDLIPLTLTGHASSSAPELHEMYRILKFRYGTTTELEVAAAWMMHLLSLMRHMKSSEARDKIYSIIGLAKFFSSKVDDLVTPDYDQPAAKVYTTLTATLLLNSRYLSILAHVGDISNNQLRTLPSWVVDYSNTNTTNPILDLGRGQATRFDASLSSELPPFPRKIEGARLTLVGARFDHLIMVSPVTLSKVTADVSHFEEFLNFVGHIPDSYFDGQPRTEILWRTMMLDSENTTASNSHLPSSSFAKGFQAWIINTIGLWVADVVQKGEEIHSANESARQIFAQLYPDTQIEVPEELQGDDKAFTLYHKKRMLPFVQSIECKVYGRKLFMTKNNFVGMGSRSIQADDQVWLIRDSRTPLILRPKPGTQDLFLVGEAYLHGFMHGEMLDHRWGLEERIGPVTIV